MAEDLGVITPEVDALRTEFGLPGMKVLQFAFDGSADNPYLPERHGEQSVVYTGTHDNDTTLGWWTSLDEATRERVRSYQADPDEPMPWALIRLAPGVDGPAGRRTRPGPARPGCRGPDEHARDRRQATGAGGRPRARSTRSWRLDYARR